jgi:hypothetical protein
MGFNKLNWNLMDLSKANKRDYRFIPFGFITIFILALLFSEFYLGSYVIVVKYFVRQPYSYFYDLKILLSGIDAFRNNINAYKVASIDGVPLFCYPATWKIFSFLPFITISNLIYIGLGLVFAFYIALYFYIGKINLFGGIVYTLLLMSTSFLLLVVQGNSDIIIFLLILIPLFYNRSRILFAGTILALGTLKLFPIGALICVFNDRKHRLQQIILLFTVMVVLLFIYLVIMKDNIIAVSHLVPKPTDGPSYGLWSIPSLLSAHFHFSPALSLYFLFSFGLLLFISCFIYYQKLSKEIQSLVIHESNNGTSYLIGAGIFITTCIIGFNYEYRLIFLILTIPQILNWVNIKKPFANTLLLLTIIITWQYKIMNELVPIKYHYHYHILIQLVVIFLFFGHFSVVLNFFLRRFNQGNLLKKA